MGMLDDLRNEEPSEGGGDDFAQGWRPDPGDGIEGIVVKVNSRVHDNHPDGYPVVTVRTPQGEEWAIHGMPSVLKNELLERNLRPGDELAVIYDGTKQSRAGRSFHAYRVASKPGNGGAPAPQARQQPQQAPQQQTPQPSKYSEVPF